MIKFLQQMTQKFEQNQTYFRSIKKMTYRRNKSIEQQDLIKSYYLVLTQLMNFLFNSGLIKSKSRFNKEILNKSRCFFESSYLQNNMFQISTLNKAIQNIDLLTHNQSLSDSIKEKLKEFIEKLTDIKREYVSKIVKI